MNIFKNYMWEYITIYWYNIYECMDTRWSRGHTVWQSHATRAVAWVSRLVHSKKQDLIVAHKIPSKR